MPWGVEVPPRRLMDLLAVIALLLAAQQSVIELSAADKAFISTALNGHALKA